MVKLETRNKTKSYNSNNTLDHKKQADKMLQHMYSFF